MRRRPTPRAWSISGTVRATSPSSSPASTKPANLLISDGDGFIKRPTDAGYIDIGGDAAVPAAIRGGDPFANLDLIRGTVHILSDGGSEVDGPRPSATP